ncbi:MAG: exonuclease domain-containing protein [Myxococcota bacterium]
MTGRDLPKTFVALDFELANRSPRSVCELGAVAIADGKTVWEMQLLFSPEPPGVTFHRLHGHTEETLHGAPRFPTEWPLIQPHLSRFSTWVAHNAAFERRVLRETCRYWRLVQPRVQWICTMNLAAQELGKRNRSLSKASAALSIPLQHHCALSDARAASLLLMKLATARR